MSKRDTQNRSSLASLILNIKEDNFQQRRRFSIAFKQTKGNKNPPREHQSNAPVTLEIALNTGRMSPAQTMGFRDSFSARNIRSL